MRGIAVHEAARILGLAAPGQVLVSAVTRALAAASGFTFTTLGAHSFKGLSGDYELFDVTPS